MSRRKPPFPIGWIVRSADFGRLGIAALEMNVRFGELLRCFRICNEHPLSALCTDLHSPPFKTLIPFFRWHYFSIEYKGTHFATNPDAMQK